MGLTGGDNALNALRLVLASIVILEVLLLAGPRSGWTDAVCRWLRGGRILRHLGLPHHRKSHEDGHAAISLAKSPTDSCPPTGGSAFTALVVAPVSAKITSSPYAWDEAGKYVTWNSMLVTPILGIGGSPHGVPYAGLWNGPLWTLTFEAGAYLFFGLLVALPGFGARTASRILIGLSVLTTMQFGAGVAPRFDPDLARLWSFFAAGALLWFIRGGCRCRHGWRLPPPAS